jgi:hypothetical protein
MTRPDDEYDDFFYVAEWVPPEPLGLLPCLSVEIYPESSGCFVCKRKQPAGSHQVWVPMDVKPGDAAASVAEACEDPRGYQAAWCLECARTLGGA